MALSEFEIRKITEIVAGQVGSKVDAKELRRVIDSVVDKMQTTKGNPEIEGVTCDVPRSQTKAISDAQTDVQTERSEGIPLASGGLYQQIEQTDANRIIVAAFGKNRPGVVAAITKVLAELNCSIEDISQTIMQEFFSMIMVVNMKECTMDFATLRDAIKDTETKLGMKVYVMHEDIFRYMHRI